jgi:hypothetical protein
MVFSSSGKIGSTFSGLLSIEARGSLGFSFTGKTGSKASGSIYSEGTTGSP